MICEKRVSEGEFMPKYRKEFEHQFIIAKDSMEKKRRELDLLIELIKSDPNRDLNSDSEAWQKNIELSNAIQEYIRLEKLYNIGKSECY